MRARTTRDAYELAELLSGITGRGAMELVRWAARRARTTQPGPVFRQLEQLTTDFVAGRVPADLPEPITLNSTTPILLYNAVSEEEN